MSEADLEKPEYQITDHMKEAGTHWLLMMNVRPATKEKVEEFWKHILRARDDG